MGGSDPETRRGPGSAPGIVQDSPSRSDGRSWPARGRQCMITSHLPMPCTSCSPDHAVLGDRSSDARHVMPWRPEGGPRVITWICLRYMVWTKDYLLVVLQYR